MLRSPRRPVLWFLMAATLSGAATSRAQYYPPGYGGYGWRGWGGATVAGRTAAGMGAFAAGAGRYNVNTAAARSMNVQTAEQYNDYMWERTHQAAQVYYQELAAEAAQGKKDYKQIQDRILNNPEDHDLENGDTLNALLIEITAPKMYARTLQAASQPIPGSMVKQIPFNYASAALTYSLEQLTSPATVPDIFSDPAFVEVRKQVRAAAEELRKKTAGSQPPKPETIKKFRAGLDAARKILESKTAAGTVTRREGENYLKALYGLSRMLDTPAYDVFLAGVEKIPTVPLRDLLSFMHSFNLRFGPAKTPEQRELYAQLYGLLSDLRQAGGPTAPPPPAPAIPGQGLDPRITNFFSSMDYSHLTPPSSPPPPPQPHP